MAAINLLDRKDVQEILANLEEKSQKASELNETIVLNQSLCSTATLYRRLKELQLASIITKEDEIYSLTEFGKSIYGEYKEKSEFVLNAKFNKILKILKDYGEMSTSEILKILSISPNTLVEILKELERREMINKILKHSKSSKGGRPSNHYRISPKGKRSRKEYKDLRDKVHRQ